MAGFVFSRAQSWAASQHSLMDNYDRHENDRYKNALDNRRKYVSIWIPVSPLIAIMIIIGVGSWILEARGSLLIISYKLCAVLIIQFAIIFACIGLVLYFQKQVNDRYKEEVES